MNKRILCLFLMLMLTLCGCGNDASDQDRSATSTTTANNEQAIPSASTSAQITATTSEPLASLGSNSSITLTTSITSLATVTTSQTTTATGTTSATVTLSTTTTSPTSTSATTHPSTTTVPSTSITFTATVRNENRQPVSGVQVSVWQSSDVYLGYGVTDQNGVVRIDLEKSSSYRVRLTNLPNGYEADEEYLFSGNVVNITIRKAAVQDEKDHSNAQYEEGNIMTDFSLTDTDGNAYRLSDLCKEKQLVILDFWFANCEPCKSEFPFFETAVETYGDDITLLAINPIDTIQTIKDLRDQFNSDSTTVITFPMIQDACNLYLGFEVTAFPTTVFINADGMIMDIHVGAFPTEEALLTKIQHYLP